MTRAVAFSLVLLVATAQGLVPRTARADGADPKGSPLYVLSVWTNDADDQAEGLTAALRARVRKAPGWSLVEATQSFETLAIALKCPPTPNASCLERIGDQLHADRYVWGTMAKEKAGEVTADMRLWTRGKPQVEASESYSEDLKDPASEPLRAVAARLFTKLAGAPGEGEAEATAGGDEHSGASELAKVEREPDKGPSTFPLRKVVGYSAVVAGVGLLVAGGVEGLSWMSDKSASDTDRTSVPRTVSDVCAAPSTNAAAADACQKTHDASNAALLGWVFTGAGAVLAGAGVILVLTDHGSSDSAAAARTRVAVTPALGARSGGLDVRVTF